MDEPLFHVISERFFDGPGAEERDGLRSWERAIVARHLAQPGALLAFERTPLMDALAGAGHAVTLALVSGAPHEGTGTAVRDADAGDRVLIVEEGRIPCSAGVFDAAVITASTLTVLPFYHQRLRLLRECAGVLKPAGRLLVAVPEPAERENAAAGEALLLGAPPLEAVCFLHYFPPAELLGQIPDAALRSRAYPPQNERAGPAVEGSVRLSLCEKV